MIFNTHSHLEGQHSFLSPSNYHWMNYDDEKLDRKYVARLASMRGQELHKFAAESIRLGVKLQATDTLGLYVNDAIDYGMSPEQVLFYSENAFGTSDAVGFRRNKLRIHDLKNGQIPGSFHQLEIYAALFCLEYEVNPFEIEMELRLYQHDGVQFYFADPDDIMHIMETIKRFDKRIKQIRMEALS